MQRAKKKLQLSHNVIDDEVSKHVGKDFPGAGPGDLKSMIYGLRLFDPEDSNKEKLSEPKLSELKIMASEVLAQRDGERSEDMGSFVISPISSSGDDFGMVRADATVNLDPGLDEASYRSWVENFKKVAEMTDKVPMELESRRVTSEQKHERLAAARKKSEEKKLAKWQTLGYQSLSVPDPVLPVDADLMSDSGAVNFVLGDCTNPCDVCPSEPTIIFR